MDSCLFVCVFSYRTNSSSQWAGLTVMLPHRTLRTVVYMSSPCAVSRRQCQKYVEHLNKLLMLLSVPPQIRLKATGLFKKLHKHMTSAQTWNYFSRSNSVTRSDRETLWLQKGDQAALWSRLLGHTHTWECGNEGPQQGPLEGFQICDAEQGACGCFQHFQSLSWALRAWNWSSVDQRIYIKTLNWSFKIMSSMSDRQLSADLFNSCVCVCVSLLYSSVYTTAWWGLDLLLISESL